MGINKLFSFPSIGLHTKLVYAYVKTEKTFYKAAQLGTSFLGAYSSKLWSVHSCLKLGKPFYKTKEKRDKKEDWVQKTLGVCSEKVRGLKQGLEIVSILHYNELFLLFYKSLGLQNPIPRTLAEEFDTILFHFTPLKTGLKIYAVFKKYKSWKNIQEKEKTTPVQINLKKWDYVQSWMFLGASSLSFIVWGKSIVERSFPHLAPSTTTTNYLKFGIYAIKFGTSAINLYCFYIKQSKEPKNTPPLEELKLEREEREPLAE